MTRFLSLILISGISLAAKGSVFSFAELFRYHAENLYYFDAAGRPAKGVPPPPGRKNPICMTITPEGCYQITDTTGHSLTGQPGEQLFPCAVLQGKYYLLSEKGHPFRRLVRWIPETGETLPIGKAHAAEVFSIITDDRQLFGIQYVDRHCEFFDSGYASLHQKICAQYPDSFPIWRENSPVRRSEWLIEALLPDRPALWLLANVADGTIREISPSPDLPDFGKKQSINYPARDGVPINAVLSYPPAHYGKKQLPLVVFPHGGPGSTELPFFDPRVAFLTAHGFLVLQPNYRGSAGFGGEFRRRGWQAEGIRAALDDIARGAEFLVDRGIADPCRIAILGGSWGGYCALASLGFYPKLYCCGISLFGASDLPEMLRSFPQKSHADAALDRLQYGDVNDPGVEEKLKEISPVFLTEKITAPVFLVHYRQDQVIEFPQSVTFHQKMQDAGKSIKFLSGNGEHGFDPPEKEAEIYQQIVDFIQSNSRSTYDRETPQRPGIARAMIVGRQHRGKTDALTTEIKENISF